MAWTALFVASGGFSLAALALSQPAQPDQSPAIPVPRPLVTLTQVTSRAASPSSVTEGVTPPVTTSSAPAEIVEPIWPTRIWMSSIQRNNIAVYPGVSAVEYDGHTGQQRLTFPVPPNLTDITWWRGGPNPEDHIAFAPAPRPGAAGVAILTMHSSLGNIGYGVGNRLGELQQGQKINLEGQNRRRQNLLLTFQVIRTTQHLDKTDPNALRNAIQQAPAGTRLVLITCSGSVDSQLSSSNFNTVVYAGLKSAAQI